MAKRKPYRFLIYLTARFTAALLACLPRPLLLFTARLLGRAAYVLVARHRNAAIQNLTLAFGPAKSEKEIHEIARLVFENLAQTCADILLFPKIDLHWLERFVETGDTLEICRKLLAEGKGMILVTSHIGNWELFAAVFTLNGFPGKPVVRRVRYKPFNQWIEKFRRSVKVEVIYRSEYPKEIIQLLRKGEIVGMLPDQDISSLKGIFVNFFGKPAYTSITPVRLALQTSAPIVTSFLIRLPKDRYQLVLGDIVRPTIKTTREAAILEYTQQWMKSCEEVIRRYPEQWVWMHNRWKTKGEVDLG